jgi:hypothetical protein
MAKLEESVTEIRAGIKANPAESGRIGCSAEQLAQDVAKLTVDLARIDGRVSQMPTLIPLITVVVAIWGMAFATLRFAGY